MSDTQDPTSTPQPGAPATGGQTGTPPPAPPAAPPPPAAGEPPGGPAPDYERKFKGLQPVHQNLQEQHKALLAEKATLATQLQELQGTIESVRGEFGSLKTDHEKSVANLEEAHVELVDYKLWERKLNRLRQTAPHLAQFEKFITLEVPDELLGDPSQLSEEHRGQLDAAIDAAIAEFGGLVGAYIEQGTKAQQAGAIPPSSPGKGGQPTLESLYDLAVSKAGTPEYEGLMAQYQKLAQQQLPGSKDELDLWRPHGPTELPVP